MRKVMLAGGCLALAACGGGGAAAGPVVRDSAGIRIVQNDAPAWKPGQEWRVSAEPALDIGVVEGAAAYQFDDVSGVARLPDGRVVVADGGSAQLRFFSADGRHLVTSGRKGGGPGEFSAIHWMGVASGDSVLVWDAESSRMSVFAPDGRFVRAFTPPGLRTFPHVEGLMGGGALLMTPGFAPGAGAMGREGEFRDTAVWMRVPLAGGAPREVARRPGWQKFLSKGTDLVMTEQVVFGRGPHATGAPDGFYAGDNDRYQIEHRAPDGTLRRLIRRAHQARLVMETDLDRYWARRAEGRLSGVPAEVRAQLEEMQRTLRERIPHRETLPAFAQLQVDGVGNLWVRDPRPDDSQPFQWSVFDPQGRWLGTVQTPGGLIVHQIGSDWILGTEKDEMDVEHVRMYRIRKPAA